MTAQKKQLQINLLPEANFAYTTVGRILTWILTSFRVIVIVTEIIVMIAFLSRFWLDAKNTDLNDKIKEKSAVIRALSNFEKEFETTQNKLKVFSQITKNEGVFKDIIKTTISYLPSELFLTSLTIKEDSLEIEGITTSEISLQQLITNLNSTKKFSDISIGELGTDSKDPNILVFKLNLNISKKEEI